VVDVVRAEPYLLEQVDDPLPDFLFRHLGVGRQWLGDNIAKAHPGVH